MALKLIACVLLMEITTFLRETYRNLPRNQSRSSSSRLEPRPSHNWSDVLQSTVAFGRAQSRDHGVHSGNVLTAVTPVTNPATAAVTPSGLTVATTNNRRWSVAAQSIASGHGSSVCGGTALTPTTESIPATTMTKLVSSGAAGSGHGERKISFVIQDDSESATSSQTTLAIQVRLLKGLCIQGQFLLVFSKDPTCQGQLHILHALPQHILWLIDL